MRAIKARVQNYRSIRDTGYFDIESYKTIMVGPNEAGKTAILKALQQINPPKGIKGFDPLRDYPRALYSDITKGNVDVNEINVVEVHFTLDEDDKKEIPEEYHDCTYVYGKRLDNSTWYRIDNGPKKLIYGDIKNDLIRLAAHVDQRNTSDENKTKHTESLNNITSKYRDNSSLILLSQKIKEWLIPVTALVDEDNEKEEKRLSKLNDAIQTVDIRDEVLNLLNQKKPVFVLYSNYFRVKPSIHLEYLAQRLESGILDDEQYDYGNKCLLKLLGFDARQLSNLGKASIADPNDMEQQQKYRDQLDSRSYQLNAASVKLTNEIRSIWFSDSNNKAQADKLMIRADSQYLKVIVEDDIGVEIELDQRSEGFQWLVSFFVVFFSEAEGENKNAILLLDEPGLNLHALKQRDFRKTISRLAEKNQTIYTTHSPFLVAPDELDLVRVVEMTDRNDGTKIHCNVTANDPAALLPLQEALGYDLAQSLFTQKKNLILEGLTDYWYVEAMAELLREAGIVDLDNKIALVPANTAGKVVYFATILHAQKLKVAALLDSDNAGKQAAEQEVLVHTLGNKKILRTEDHIQEPILKSEIEDMMRSTLVKIAKENLNWDITEILTKSPNRPIVSIFEAEIKGFSKYKLAKAFLRWARDNEASNLEAKEIEQWKSLIEKINSALK